MKFKKPSLFKLCTKDEATLSLPSWPVTLEEGKEVLIRLHQHFNPDEGVGLAAPQLGIHKRVCMIHISDDKYPGGFKLDLVNPIIRSTAGETIRHKEMCFSVSKRTQYAVARHTEITVEDDLNGAVTVSGFPAFVVQHEVDHLNGITIRAKGTKVGMRPIVRNDVKVGRNAPCPCGSGKKHKKCCGDL